MIFGIFLRRHLLNLCKGVDNAKNQYGSSEIERPCDGFGNLTFGCLVLESEPRQHKREQETDYRPCIAEKTLYGICEPFLLLVDHVADEHLERLHRDIDRQIEKHQSHSSEYQCAGQCEMETAGIGKQTHDDHGQQRSENKIREASSEPTPGAVAECADNRLDNETGQRGQQPEVTEFMRVGAESGEDT